MVFKTKSNYKIHSLKFSAEGKKKEKKKKKREVVLGVRTHEKDIHFLWHSNQIIYYSNFYRQIGFHMVILGNLIQNCGF